MIRLEVISGADQGRVYEITTDVAFVGRAPQNEVVLDEGHVSGRHLRLVQGLDGAVTIEDLGSTNGSALIRAGARIVLGEGTELLVDGDEIVLGHGDETCALSVRFVEEGPAAHLVSVKRVDGEASLPDDPVTLRALYDALSAVGRARDLDSVLQAIADSVFALVPHATHVTVVLEAVESPKKAPKTRNFLPVLTRVRPQPSGPAPSSESGPSFVPIARSVYRKVLEERAAVLAADAPKEVGPSPSLMGASIRSCVAVPLWDGDEILGVLQVDNRDAPGMLKGGDLDVLLCLAEPASLAVANGRLIKRLTAAEQRLRQENAFLRGRDRERRGGGTEVTIIGESEPMRALDRQLAKVADTNVTVLIEGETGTGKELVAAALHHRSRRRDELFVAQNCAALAETLLESELFGHKKGSFTGAVEDKKGLFELADGSTLFLDEITEAPASIQSKLLRALQEGEVRPVGASEPRRVNVRVVAATNRNLEDEVRAGRFREDLYYRLKVFPLRVPPLRERRDDIPRLVSHFLERYSAEIGKAVAGISAEAEHILVAYDWPGNVRELQNEVQRVVIQVDPGAFVTPDLLSPRMRRGEDIVARAGASRGTLKETLLEVEKYLVYEALRAHDNNKTNTAKALGITREGLHKKLRVYES
ncbi:MAG: sigma 54-interacting transcriptional regulator [Polyangiaceae bacterium]